MHAAVRADISFYDYTYISYTFHILYISNPVHREMSRLSSGPLRPCLPITAVIIAYIYIKRRVASCRGIGRAKYMLYTQR